MKKILLILSFSYLFFAQVPPENFKQLVQYLASDELEGRGLGTQGATLAKNYIENAFKSAGLKPFFEESYFQVFSIKFQLAWVNPTNIAGFIEGSDATLKNEFIVIGAHYDHVGYEIEGDQKIIYNGADDNASGVSMLIELAKSLASTNPKRSILFIAFDAEESGLLGAYHFIKTLGPDKQKQIKKLFSLDMVGMLEANKKLELKGITQLVQGKDIVEPIGNKYGIKLDKVNDLLEQRTDTYPFGVVGIPSTHVFTGLKSPYHKPEDTFDLLDYKGMQKIHQFMHEVALTMANATALNAQPSLQKLAMNPGKIKKPFKFGFTVNLANGQHLYKEEFFDAKPKFSFAAGLASNLVLNKNVSLNLEALYDSNASRSANGTFRRHSVTIPLNIEFGTNSNAPFRAFLYGGAFYRYHFSGTDGGESLDFEQVFRQNDWGLSLGGGLEIEKLRFTFGSRSSMNSIFQDANFADIRARESIFLGLTFRL